MILSYRSASLEKRITDYKKCVAHYGQNRARNIIKRRDQMIAADCLADLFKFKPANCHEHIGNERGLFTVDISPNFRLYFQPIEVEKIPKPKDQILDYNSIKEVTIIKIDDPH